MPRHIAFLRALNVGGRIVKMEVLRQIFESLEFTNVETFIASGNVIFESPTAKTATLEKLIETTLLKSLGYEVKTMIRSPKELKAVANYQPFPLEEMEATGHSLYVAFLADEPDVENREKLIAYRSEIDDFHIHGRELYWLCRVKSSESKFTNVRLEKTLKMAATTRNLTTVRRLVAKYPPVV